MGNDVLPCSAKSARATGNQGGKLKAVAGEAGGKDDVAELRVTIHDEIFIGRHGIETGSRMP